MDHRWMGLENREGDEGGKQKRMSHSHRVAPRGLFQRANSGAYECYIRQDLCDPGTL